MTTTVAELAELAEELIRRAVRDLQSQGSHARESWAWLMLPEQSGESKAGWDLEDACMVLGTEAATVRRALLRRGYWFPPTPQQRAPGTKHGRPKAAGIITCRTCGVPVPTADVPTTRTCVACGQRYQRRYLKLRGLLSTEKGSTCPPRRHAGAALRLLLQRGPLPGAYVRRQLERAGFTDTAIRHAREQQAVAIRRRDGFTTWEIPKPGGGEELSPTPGPGNGITPR